MKNLILLTALLASLTACKKDSFAPVDNGPGAVDPNEPKLPITVISASFSSNAGNADVTADVIAKCSGAFPAVGHCDYAPHCNAYTYNPLCSTNPTAFSNRFTATYTCGTDPTVFYVSYGDNGLAPANSSNDALGRTVRLSCSGSHYDASKVITVVTASLGTNVNDWIYTGTSGGGTVYTQNRPGPKADTQNMCNGAVGSCKYFVDATWIGDSYPGQSKRLTIKYQCGGVDHADFVYGQNALPPTASNNADHQTVTITCP